MWVAKLWIKTDNTLIGSLAVKHNINLFGFPLSYYYDRDWVIVNMSANVLGKEKDKRRFISDLKKKDRLVNIEIKNDFLLMTIKEPLPMKCLYNKDIIHVEPGVISSEGYESGTCASFKRSVLMDLARVITEKYGGKMLSIRKKKISSISVMKVSPNLTQKQKDALNLAIKNGYYNVPRKISVEKLAEISGLSFSTFQVHLRKAESKIIPNFNI